MRPTLVDQRARMVVTRGISRNMTVALSPPLSRMPQSLNDELLFLTGSVANVYALS